MHCTLHPQVNGVEMTGKTQRDAVAMLRNTPLGSTVLIVVSRHEQEMDEEETTPQDERFRVPRPLVRITLVTVCYHGNHDCTPGLSFERLITS
ncbi:hypothetical protein DPMN_064361 [Dreissena polymorpha]|uniref:Uncharacterized protein n=1 Tax=Dreissena polymorpha TaxID=45954 RepID=A0A9D4CC44_DREPO|nr:hypothetical protein DPMN_064361 [Dreissena polymorpha]